MAAKKKPAAESAPSAEAAPAKPKYFVIAENRALCGTTVEHDWRWTKKGTGWIDGQGNAVAYLADTAALMAQIAKGPVRLYEGYRWYAVIAPHQLDAIKKTGAVEVMATPVIS